MAYDNNATVQAMLPAMQEIGLHTGTGVNLQHSIDPTLRALTVAQLAMVGLVIGVLTEFGVKKANGQALTLSDFAAGLELIRHQTYDPIPPPS